MICLSGQVGRRRDVAFLRERGHGRLIASNCWKNPIDGLVYGIDNGAFAAWTNGEPFPEQAFLKMLAKVPRDRPPFMAVCPDKVAAPDSLAFSRRWRQRLERLGYGWLPWYLAVQDGMGLDEISRELRSGRWAGLFVGGTRTWKRATAAAWIDLAHQHGRPCHVGMVPALADLLWAEAIGADSVDSTSWARNDRHQVLDALAQQARLPPARGTGGAAGADAARHLLFTAQGARKGAEQP